MNDNDIVNLSINEKLDSTDSCNQLLIDYCEQSLEILNNYYSFSEIPKIKNFILPPSEKEFKKNQVLIFEENNYIYVGIQFSQNIYEKIKKNELLDANDIAIISEEISHFCFLCDLISLQKSTNILNLEVLGEIDRFLCLMHWNYINKKNEKLKIEWKNFHEICDYVFTGNRFSSENINLYIQAENIAFKHLKNAFSNNWDYSHINFSKVEQEAKFYLNQVRQTLLA
jgi:hypothetical protein